MRRKKLPRNWRIEKTLLSRREWSNSTKVEWFFYAAWSGISNSEFITGSNSEITRTIGIHWRFENLQDPDSQSSFGSVHVSHQALMPSSSKMPSRESRMQRNTREDMSIPEAFLIVNLPEEHLKNSRSMAASSGIQRREGVEKGWSEAHLNNRNCKYHTSNDVFPRCKTCAK